MIREKLFAIRRTMSVCWQQYEEKLYHVWVDTLTASLSVQKFKLSLTDAFKNSVKHTGENEFQ